MEKKYMKINGLTFKAINANKGFSERYYQAIDSDGNVVAQHKNLRALIRKIKGEK